VILMAIADFFSSAVGGLPMPMPVVQNPQCLQQRLKPALGGVIVAIHESRSEVKRHWTLEHAMRHVEGGALELYVREERDRTVDTKRN
jgi:hypothetical protein